MQAAQQRAQSQEDQLKAQQLSQAQAIADKKRRLAAKQQDQQRAIGPNESRERN